jgi:hypothetical protein
MKLKTEPQAPMRHDPDSGSFAEIRDGLIVLHLKGDPYRRGLAHGRLLRREIRHSRITRYFSSMLNSLYRGSPLSHGIPASIRRRVAGLLEWWFYTPLESLFLEETRNELRGVADGAEIDLRSALRAALSPDLMEHMAAGLLKTGKPTLLNDCLAGCSGVYARRSALRRGGQALLARNMDFPGAIVWRYPVVIFSHPEEQVDVVRRTSAGGFVTVRQRKAPYVYVSAAGFPGYGLTGMSAAGIAAASFVVLSRNVARRGLLSLDYNHYLLTRAESLEGIRHLIETEKLRSAAPHTVLFADREEAMSVEVDSRRSAVRRTPESSDILVQTNHFLDPQMQRREMVFPLARENSVGRFCLLQDALQSSSGRIDVQRMVDVISANLDRTAGATRLLGDFPAQLHNLTSAVFEPGTGSFWVAGGTPPAVCYNRFSGFNLHRELEGRESQARLPSYRRSDRPVLPGTIHTPIDGPAGQSMRLLVRSQERLKIGRPEAALRYLEKARALVADPAVEYLLALLYLINGKTETALDLFRRLRTQGLFPPVKAAALRLWEGRCLDILGRRQEAKACYRTLLRRPGLAAGLREAARRHLRRRYLRRMLPRSFDYSLLGPLSFT